MKPRRRGAETDGGRPETYNLEACEADRSSQAKHLQYDIPSTVIQSGTKSTGNKVGGKSKDAKRRSRRGI
ncbi:uncharacterized protein N7459_003262 [Penicillium hispanicum]|uniref:uncharacterized protein n=1 Tax=Penicillium hispanicum TaxID=1080232 RepID=UPI0025401D32|nr:uncharacterized protein N7459_003262 [Penicillium hispanicum]KAJ5587497.1 hypothetical protein N7459_003262 [Penicillium hispanicum]